MYQAEEIVWEINKCIFFVKWKEYPGFDKYCNVSGEYTHKKEVMEHKFGMGNCNHTLGWMYII